MRIVIDTSKIRAYPNATFAILTQRINCIIRQCGQDAKELLKTLQSRNERMFQLTFLVLNTADTRQKLENEIFWALSLIQIFLERRPFTFAFPSLSSAAAIFGVNALPRSSKKRSRCV